jgi:hypothetical protein
LKQAALSNVSALDLKRGDFSLVVKQAWVDFHLSLASHIHSRSLAFAKVYTSKMPITAADTLIDRMLPFYQALAFYPEHFLRLEAADSWEHASFHT